MNWRKSTNYKIEGVSVVYLVNKTLKNRPSHYPMTVPMTVRKYGHFNGLAINPNFFARCPRNVLETSLHRQTEIWYDDWKYQLYSFVFIDARASPPHNRQTGSTICELPTTQLIPIRLILPPSCITLLRPVYHLRCDETRSGFPPIRSSPVARFTFLPSLPSSINSGFCPIGYRRLPLD